MTASARSIALAAAIVALHVSPVAAKDEGKYVFTPLAAPDGGGLGFLVGVYQDQAIGWHYTANNTPEAFVWSAGNYTLIPGIDIVSAVSDSGVAVGVTPGSTTSYTTYDVTSGATKTINFGPAGGKYFSIQGINSSGAIVATQYTTVMEKKPKTACQSFEQDANGSYTWLSDAKPNGFGAMGLTDNGVPVIGRNLDCGGPFLSPYSLYKGGMLKRFNIPNQDYILMAFVSGSGFGGYFEDRNTQQDLGFASTGGKSKLAIYALPPGRVDMGVTAIGLHNEVAGYSIDTSGYYHGFVYSGKTYHTIDYPHYKSTIITGLSSTGAIVGYFGNDPDSHGENIQPFIATCASDKGCTR